MKFTQGIAQGHPRKGDGKGKSKGPGIVLANQAWHPHQQAQYQQHQPQLRPQKGSHQVRNAYVQQPGGGADDPVLQEFVLKWSLHEEAQTMLFGLDAATQTKVVQEFAPRDTSRDCNSVFCKFVQCVSAGASQKGGGSFVPYGKSQPAIVPAKGGKGVGTGG